MMFFACVQPACRQGPNEDGVDMCLFLLLCVCRRGGFDLLCFVSEVLFWFGLCMYVKYVPMNVFSVFELKRVSSTETTHPRG